MAIMVYALYTYHWRAASIRRGGRGPYDDRLGRVSFHGSFVFPHFDISAYIDYPLRRSPGYAVPHWQIAQILIRSPVAVIANFILRFTEG